MSKKLIIWIIVSGLVMVGFPFLIVTFTAEAGMMLCFMLFFVVNPIYSIVIGCVAGKEMKRLWILPILSAVLFLAGVWLFLTMEEILFVWYALVYLILGLGAMIITHLICKRKQ